MRYRNLGMVAFLLLLVGTLGVSAQRKKPTPKPLATPPTLTGAEIIGQAADYTEPQPTPEQATVPRTGGTNTVKIKDLNDRVNKLEADKKTGYDEKQRLLLLNLDILTRAEQRSEALRKQVFEMIEKENTIKTRLDQIEYDIRPEVIDRNTIQIAGSLRPEEVRENRRKTLDGERRNLQSLLTQIQNTHASLDAASARADQLVDKLREKLEKDIDDALLKDEKQPDQ
jgi:hypothetical protein